MGVNKGYPPVSLVSKAIPKNATDPNGDKAGPGAAWKLSKFQIFSALAGMFHVNLCRGSWGPTGSVLNFEMMKHAFWVIPFVDTKTASNEHF